MKVLALLCGSLGIAGLAMAMAFIFATLSCMGGD